MVGVASSILIFMGILAAIGSIAWLRGLLRARAADETSLGIPPIHSPAPVVASGLAAPVILPIVFVTVWLYLLTTERF